MKRLLPLIFTFVLAALLQPVLSFAASPATQPAAKNAHAHAARAAMRPVCDLAHNMVEITNRGALHRKGAAPSDRGLVPVPGSRGTLSYLVEPIRPLRPEALVSLAHGAGRRVHDCISRRLRDTLISMPSPRPSVTIAVPP